MKTTCQLNKKNLFRLPYSINDCPIGWIEATDVCNIRCKGCYRLVMGEGHKPKEKIKEEILFLKNWRNCDGISLAGGEPILHPDILEILSFIRENNLKSLLLTNGYALNDKILMDMKAAGLFGLSFHIDSTQSRPDVNKKKIESESELNELRTHYARLVKKHGFYSHFGITVTPSNFHEVPVLIQWALDHMEYVNGLSLIIFRGMPIMPGVEYYANGKKINVELGSLGYTVDQETYEKSQIKTQDVYSTIKEHFPDYDAMGYLGGTIDHTSFKHLYGSILVNSQGKTFGAMGKRTLELVQGFTHYFHGTYLVYPKKRIGKKLFLMALFDPKIRQALTKFLRYVASNPLRWFYPLKSVGIGIIQAPDMLEDGRIDMCDDCPDLCVHEGKLVNSCRLDECRIYGGLLHIHVDKNLIHKREPAVESMENV